MRKKRYGYRKTRPVRARRRRSVSTRRARTPGTPLKVGYRL